MPAEVENQALYNVIKFLLPFQLFKLRRTDHWQKFASAGKQMLKVNNMCSKVTL